MKHLNKYLRIAFTNFVLGAIAFFVLQFIYWQVFPYQTAEIVEPMEVLNENNEVKRGDNLRVELTFTKYTDVTPSVSRNVFCLDNSVHFVTSQPSTGTARPIGTFTATPEYGLSDDVPTDTLCFFQFTNEYKVNPIRSITKTWRTESFKIVE